MAFNRCLLRLVKRFSTGNLAYTVALDDTVPRGGTETGRTPIVTYGHHTDDIVQRVVTPQWGSPDPSLTQDPISDRTDT